MDVRELTIEPVTRIEGHSRVTIFVDKKKVKGAHFNIVESPRFFEKLLEGKFAEEAPRITQRICGVCPVAHHLASVKAVEAAWDCSPPAAAVKLRTLMLVGQMISSHSLHLGFLALPDLLDVDDRSILGVARKYPRLASSIFKLNRFGLQMTEAAGGRAVHPVSAIPGGMSKSLDGEQRDQLLVAGKECMDMACEFADLLDETMDGKGKLIECLDLGKTRYMGLTRDGQYELYDGNVAVLEPSGKKEIEFEPKSYLNQIVEKTVPHSYAKHPYLRRLGYPAGIYRVGPLARLNVAARLTTSKAGKYLRSFAKKFGKPAHNTFAYDFARAVELVHMVEQALDMLGDPVIESSDAFTCPRPKAGRGVGIVEAPRGTLIHDYETDADGLITKANIISPTTHNAPSIESDVLQLAGNLLPHMMRNEQEMLSRIEILIRAYDPCLTCSAHFVELREIPTNRCVTIRFPGEASPVY